MFFIIAVAAAGGIWTHYLPRDGAIFGQVMLYHKSLGVVLFALVILRVLLRLLLGAPAYKPPLGWFNEKLAGLAHLLLYATMIALPISGYVMTMASKHEFALFGYYPVPNYIPANESLAKAAEGGHMALAILLGALVALHLLAAVWHRWRRDGVYERMWPTAKA
jgi:cytochrome b561